MRLMHKHVEVGHEAVKTWLLCMQKAIDQIGFEESIRQAMIKTFTRAAEMVRNQE